MFYISKSLGLAPFCYDKKTLKFEVNCWNYLELTISVFIWIGLSSIEFNDFNENPYDSGIQSELLDQICQYQYLVQYFFTTFTVVFNFFKTRNVEQFLKFIFKFDKTIKKLNWNFKAPNSKYFIIAIYLISSLLLLLYQCAAVFCNAFEGFTISVVTVIRIFSYCLVTNFYLIIAMRFSLSANCISRRLKALKINIR